MVECFLILEQLVFIYFNITIFKMCCHKLIPIYFSEMLFVFVMNKCIFTANFGGFKSSKK